MDKNKIKKIKRYKINIDDIENPVEFISITDLPAIEVKGVFFNNKTNKKLKFIVDQTKGILIAPTMVPNQEIIRFDEEKDEYYIVIFDAEVIEKIVERFHRNNKNTNTINFDHQNQIVEATIIESWIKEYDEDKSNKYFDLPIGTHFIKLKFDDLDFFKEFVIEKEYSGLSIELMAGLELFNKTEDFFVIEQDVISSNVEGYAYNTDTEELTIFFNDGSAYKYFNITFDLFNQIRGGETVARTDGVNEDGRWYVGKTPSIGAAVYSFLVEANRRYIKLNKLELFNIYSEFLDDEQIKELLKDYINNDNNMKFKSYNDYPIAASNNAKRALKWVEKNGWGSCGTQVGKIRANQLANREPISYDVISRMAGFARQRQNKNTPYDKGCGGLMWDSWGGDEGVDWAQRKLKQLKNE